MRSLKKKLWLGRLPYLALLTLIYVGACTSKRSGNESVEQRNDYPEMDHLPEQELLTPAFGLDINEIDSVRILFTDDESIQAWLPADKWKDLSGHFSHAVYDKERNRDGLMIHMIAPDYTLIIQYKDRSPEENDWLMFWKESGYVKFQNVWYTLNHRESENVARLLDYSRK